MGFEQISLEHGLSQAAVFAIAQDQQGFMWFGTLDGLNKYDGYEITVYKNDPRDTTSLSENKITVFCVDGAGTLWIGTQNGGLNAFNRERETFTRYLHVASNPNSLSDNHVRAIYADASGVLWIGTFAHALDKFDPRTATFTHYLRSPSNRPDTLDARVTAIYASPADSGGVLWIGTDGSGLARFDVETKTLKSWKHDPADPHSISHNVVNTIHAKDGVLWIGTAGGGLNKLVMSDAAGGAYFARYTSNPGDPTTLSNNIVTVIHDGLDHDRLLWIATDDGLHKFDPKTGRFTRYRHNAANPKSLSNNRVSAIYADRSGTLWFGTLGGGVNKFSPGKFKFTHYRQEPANPNSLNDNFIRSIHAGNSGTLWIGTGTGGLNKFDRTKKTFRHYRHNPRNPGSLSNNSIRTIYEDRDGLVWLGTDGGGLDRFDPQTERFLHYRHDPANPDSPASNRIWVIRAAPEADAKILWLGTYGGGLDKLVIPAGADHADAGAADLTGKQVQFTHYKHDAENLNSLSSNIVLALYRDRAGTLWAGTDAGLSRLDEATGRFMHYRHDPTNANSLSNDTVISIHQDQTGALWIGTFGGGLNKLVRPRNSAEEPSERDVFKHYTEEDGLPNNIVNAILADERGNLWISTYNGLSKFDPRTETFRNFDARDGLQSNEFGYGAYFKSGNGEMFFGGINGFNAFYPDSIKDNPYLPPVVMTDFQVFNQSVPVQRNADAEPSGEVFLQKSITVADEIVLSYRHTVFSFTFAALDYTAPQKNLYAYKLAGVDKDWIYSGARRYVSYSHLAAGEYIFRVKGSNNDGVWNNKGAQVKIIITPPFWQRWWFRGSALVLLAGLLFLFHRYRVSKAVEMERLRVRIASDLHDDIGSTLTKISVHSEIIQTTGEANKIVASSKKIGEMSREIVKTLSDIVWSIDARNDAMGDLIDRMRNFAISVLSPLEVKTVFDFSGLDAAQKLPVDIRQNIYLIFKEAINNIARHAQASEVHVRMRRDHGNLSLTIRDNGKTPPKRDKAPGQGMRNMKMRAARIGAKIEFVDGCGFTVNLITGAI